MWCLIFSSITIFIFTYSLLPLELSINTQIQSLHIHQFLILYFRLLAVAEIGFRSKQVVQTKKTRTFVLVFLVFKMVQQDN